MYTQALNYLNCIKKLSTQTQMHDRKLFGVKYLINCKNKSLKKHHSQTQRDATWRKTERTTKLLLKKKQTNQNNALFASYYLVKRECQQHYHTENELVYMICEYSICAISNHVCALCVVLSIKLWALFQNNNKMIITI